MALSANTVYPIEVGEFFEYPVYAAAHIYEGSLVGLYTGYARPLTAGTAGTSQGDGFAGIAYAEADNTSGSSGDIYVKVYRNANVQMTVTSVAVTDVGRTVYASDDATLALDPNNHANPAVGIVKRYVTTNTAIVELRGHGFFKPGLLYAQDAAGTALTNSTTETALCTCTIPADVLQVGDVLRVRQQGIATATNSTDTLTLKLYFGTEEIAASTAHDVTDNDFWFFDASIVFRAVGSSGQIVATGLYTVTPDAEGTTSALPFMTAAATEATNVATTVTVKATWSVASASNSCRSDVFIVELLRKGHD